MIIKFTMDIQTMTALFNEKKQQHNIEFAPKPEQMQVALSIYNRRNCLGFLPTGFGKTLCFVVNSMLTDKLTLIISPLISLMENQLATLRAWDFTCAKISSETSRDVRLGIANGEYTFVFSSPESILKPLWRSMLLGSVWQERLGCIVFDEAHCLSEWGEDFRPDYRLMSELRSFFKVPIMAVTATSTSKIKDDIMSILQLQESDTDIITKSPNRDNIFIDCRKKTSSDYDLELDFLIQHIKNKSEVSRKTIIYCRSINVVAEVFMSMKVALDDSAYAGKVKDADHLLIEMYHKCTHESSKQRILQEFCKPNSNLRCVIATVALGMGIDIPDISLIIHIGCPSSTISYWQEAGRCARDGRQGYSLILYDNFTASLKTTEKHIGNLVKSDQCFRQQVMDYFTVSEQSKNNNTAACVGCDESICQCKLCSCCSVCAKKCPCAERNPLTAQVFLCMGY